MGLASFLLPRVSAPLFIVGWSISTRGVRVKGKGGGKLRIAARWCPAMG